MVICEGAVSDMPETWLASLRSGGRLAAVVRNGPVGKASLYAHGEAGLGAREIFDATPPMLPGFERKPQFAF